MLLRDLNLLAGYLSLQLDLGELTRSPRGRGCVLVCLHNGGLSHSWGFEIKSVPTPPDSSQGAHLSDGNVIAATAGA